MLVMGINGGLSRVNAREFASLHDSAAVLVRDGQVIAAFEEERRNRIKHTNKFPANAMRACLREVGATIRDLDRLAVNYAEESALTDLVSYLLTGRSVARSLGVDAACDTHPRRLLCTVIERELGSTLEADRIQFVKHHVCHAWSAFIPSGFERALVVTMDGQGDAGEAGYVAVADARGIEILRTTTVGDSLGMFYSYLTFFLGFNYHDEFKVMGLAPYGDPAVHRKLFQQLYELRPDGGYRIFRARLVAFISSLAPRQQSQDFDQRYKDVAAALQETLEVIAFHVLSHFQTATGLRDLCLAGGVAHNCTLNGKLLASGRFARVYVQPASHDAGCALGAALYADRGGVPGARPAQSVDVIPGLFLGTDIGDPDSVARALAAWGPLLSFRRAADVARETAALLADGQVLAWVQGRAEFGPRALGNRSILADPRPAENKAIINAMVKKREAFRPFAPAVLAERAAEYFEVPAAEADLGHMTYVLPVRQDRRDLLGAVTHVDGSARVQTVRRDQNDRFWRVIDAFGELTGVPIVLNTSFNNHAEPIVDTVEDAVVTFLTTRLNRLVVSDFVVDKAEPTYDLCRSLVPGLCRYSSLHREIALDDAGASREAIYIATSFDDRRVAVSPELARVLAAGDCLRTLGDICGALEVDGPRAFAELIDLWTLRLIRLSPRSVA